MRRWRGGLVGRGRASVRLVLLATRHVEMAELPTVTVPGGVHLRVVRVAEDGESRIVAHQPGLALPTGWTDVATAHHDLVAERLLGTLLGRSRRTTVAVGLDRTAEWALWTAGRERPELVVLASVESALRAVDLLMAGRSVASVRSSPDFVPGGTRPVTTPDSSGASRATAQVRIVTRSSTGPWLHLDADRVVVDARRLSLPERAAVAGLAEDALPRVRATGSRLVIGPLNRDGRGREVARAVVDGIPGWTAENVEVYVPGADLLPADRPLPVEEWQEPAARVALLTTAIVPATHVLLEGLRPIVAVDDPHPVEGPGPGRGRADLRAIVASGRRAAVLLDRADVARAAQEADAPGWVGLDVPLLVAEADLVASVPGSRWLPVPVARDYLRAGPRVLAGGIPVVLSLMPHGPADPAVSPGSEHIDHELAVLRALAQQGVIEHRRVGAVPAMLKERALRGADIVVDHDGGVGLSHTALCAAAMGRVVIARTSGAVDEIYPGIVRVPGADMLRGVVLDLAERAERAAAVAAVSMRSVRALHDGWRTVSVLREVFDLDG